MVWKPKIGKLETSPIYCFHSDQISWTYSVYKSRYLVIHVRTNTKNNEYESLHLFHAILENVNSLWLLDQKSWHLS